MVCVFYSIIPDIFVTASDVNHVKIDSIENFTPIGSDLGGSDKP